MPTFDSLFECAYLWLTSTFFHTILLIKNLLLLATAISLKYPSKKAYEENARNMVEYFLTVLFQPYVYQDIINSQENWIIDGNTPLTRLAYYSGRFTSEMYSCFNPSRCLHLFIYTMQKLTENNLKLYEEFESDSKSCQALQDNFIFSPQKKVHYQVFPNTEKIFSVSDIEIKDFISTDYIELENLFQNLKDNFDFTLNRHYKINVEMKSTNNLHKLIPDIIKHSQKLLVETINYYTSNINYEIFFSATEKNMVYALFPNVSYKVFFLLWGIY